MSLISIKAKPGRVAFTAAKRGDRVPTDRYIQVQMTPWINRLLNVHGDIEVEPAPAAKPEAKPEAAPAAAPAKAPAEKG